MKWIALLCIYFFSCGFAETLVGKAFDPQGNYLFCERHRIGREEGKIVSVHSKYLDPEGRIIAEMVTKPSDFPYIPNVAFKKYTNGFESGSFMQEDSIILYKKEPSRQYAKTKKIKIKNDMLLGHGLFFYISNHFKELSSGKAQKFSYLLPNRLSSYPFKLWGEPHPRESNIFVIHLKIDNWILKSFVPEIRFYYNRESQKLITYEGFNGFLFDEDRPPKLIIEYSYEEEDGASGL